MNIPGNLSTVWGLLNSPFPALFLASFSAFGACMLSMSDHERGAGGPGGPLTLLPPLDTRPELEYGLRGLGGKISGNCRIAFRVGCTVGTFVASSPLSEDVGEDICVRRR